MEGIKFDVALGDLLSGPAHKAASAVDGLSNELTKASARLAAYERRLALANKLGDIEGHRKYSAAVQETSQKVFDLGSKLDGMKEQAGPAAGELAQVGVAAGPVGAALAAVATVATAVIGTLYGLGKAGVETALEVTAARAQLEATFDALGKGPEAGRRTIEMLDDVARTLPQSREELGKWVREIEKMGVTDLGQVRRELLATASAQAILGEEGPAAFEKISRKVNNAIGAHQALKIASKEITRTIGTNMAEAVAGKMGTSLEKLEAQLKTGLDPKKAIEFGNALEDAFIEKGAKSLNAMWASKAWGKIKEAGRDVTPITEGMRHILELFDQTQPSGQAMKTTLTDVFNGIVKAIGWVITEGEVLSLRFMVYGLSMELALLPVWNILKKIGGAIDSAGQAVGLIAPPGSAPPPVKSAQASATGAVEDTVGGLTGLLTGPLMGVAGAGGMKVGEAIGQGLVNALGLAKPGVEAAANDLGETAVRGTRAGAGVKSPSKPAIEIGGYVAEGLGIGMMGGAGGAARAGRQLSTNALGGLVGGALASSAANGNAGITISGLVINLTAPQGVTDATGLSATGLAVALERLQLASGR
jgi:hypothetical protein